MAIPGRPAVSCVQHCGIWTSKEEAMNELEILLENNKVFAARQRAEGAQLTSLPDALPTVKAIIIGCADMRVDPAHVLGLRSGEAVVMRNIGGRVTPGLTQQLALLGRIGQLAGATPGGGGPFHIIVLHHTDCGITRLKNDPALLGEYFQVADEKLESKSVTDPRQSVAVDIATIRELPLPPEWLITGLVYDVFTGLAEVVVPTAPHGIG